MTNTNDRQDISTNKVKSPDMIIDNELGEIKHLSGNSYKTLIKRVAEASGKQNARIVYLNIENNSMELEKIKEAVKKGSIGHTLKKAFIAYRGVVYTMEL